MQLFGCPSTWSAPARAFYGSKLSLLLAGSCVLDCWAVGCSGACDVCSGIAWPVLGRLCWWRGGAEWSGAGRLGCAAVLLALIWKLARMVFLTIRLSGCACRLHGASDRERRTAGRHAPDVGWSAMTAMPTNAMAAPTKSQRLKAIPSTTCNQTSATAMYIPPYAA